jgi:hypothetical protein
VTVLAALSIRNVSTPMSSERMMRMLGLGMWAPPAWSGVGSAGTTYARNRA